MCGACDGLGGRGGAEVELFAADIGMLLRPCLDGKGGAEYELCVADIGQERPCLDGKGGAAFAPRPETGALASQGFIFIMFQ